VRALVRLCLNASMDEVAVIQHVLVSLDFLYDPRMAPTIAPTSAATTLNDSFDLFDPSSSSS